MRLRRFVAGAGSFALITSAVVVAAPAAADDPEIIYETSFEDGTDGWFGRGAAAVEQSDVHANSGEHSLLTTGRTDSWNGPALDLIDLEGVETGGIYRVDAQVRLADGAEPGTANLAMNRVPGLDGNEFPWIVGGVAVDDQGFAQLSGSFTIETDLDTLVLYLETDTLVDFYLDDVTVTLEGHVPPPGPTEIYSTSFEDGIEGWFGRGAAAVEQSDAHANSGEHSLLTTGRTDSWNGPALDLLTIDGIETGNSYQVEAHVRLADGAEPGTANLALNRVPGVDDGDGTNEFPWIAGGVAVDDQGFAQLSGSFTIETDLDTLVLYLETDTLVDFYLDDVVITGPPPSFSDVDLAFDFEDGTLQGWEPRDTGEGDPITVEVTDAEAHTGTYAAQVSGRNGHGDGIGYDLGEVFEVGAGYDITAWVKMAEGEPTEDIWLSIQTASSTFSTVGQFTGITAGEWVEVEASYTFPGGDLAFLYFETEYPDGGTGSFLVDDIRIRSQGEPEIEDLPSIHEFHADDFPVGVAIDQRETFGGAAELTTLHYNQVTGENHMKPEAFYDGPWNFRAHPQATAIMDFARDNDLRLFGHVLVWHSQTPDWFFQDDEGAPLTDSAEDQEEMRERMRTHIFAVAEAFHDEYGPYGSETNPLVGWDVVNEVVSDSGEFEDGLRRSEWYRILGESFIDDAFRFADEAFNDVYAAPGSDRPVTLFINDYNTEQGGKQNRYYDLVERLYEDPTIPLDGVGHQFHVSLSMPISALETAIVRFQDFDLVQAVTEMDVTVGTPVTDANVIEQGYYYRDAFRVFREYADDLWSVTIWGLSDDRSWRSAQAPLPFDGSLRAKPAYYGIMDAQIEPRVRTAFVFQGEPPVDAEGITSTEWDKLPLHEVGEVAAFQLRWSPDHLTAYLEVSDSSADPGDEVTFTYGSQTVTVGRDGSTDGGEVHVEETEDGYVVLVQLPFDEAPTQGSTLDFDVEVATGDGTTNWGDDGAMGTLTLVEGLSFVEVVEATDAPQIDGEIDDVWDAANAVTTDTRIEGADDGAKADVRLLWEDNTLFVLAEVTDEQIDTSGSDPWVQDSVEIFVDAGNARNGPYRYDDTQIRINVDNEVSVGTGDEAFQLARVESATSVTEDGYLVEAAISLLEYGGAGTFHGLDFQINDGTDGSRTAVHTWADPTGLGYQSTARWGVGQLVAGEDEEPPVDPCDRTIDGRHQGKLVVPYGTTTCLTDGADLRGGVLVAGGVLDAEDAMIRGGLLVVTGEVTAQGIDVRGGIDALMADRLEVRDSAIHGGIASVLARGPVVLSGNDVRGGVDLALGFTRPDAAIVAGNQIKGSLMCLGNDPRPTNNGEKNQVTGSRGGFLGALLNQCYRL